MDLLLVIGLAVLVALITLVLCDLAGGIARAKGSSYWALFALGLLLWFPALLVALSLPDKGGAPAGPEPRRPERAVAVLLLVLGLLAVAAGLGAALAYAP